MQYAYTEKNAVQTYLLTNIDVTFDTQLSEWIRAMSQYIDEQVGYPVFTDEETTRLYDGNGELRQLISPVHTITEVTLDDEVITPVKAPYNNPVKRELIFSDSYFTQGTANLAVTGIHSLKAELPDVIKTACTILVAGIVNQSNNQTEGVKSEKIGNYSVTYADEEEQKMYKWAMAVIASYRPINF